MQITGGSREPPEDPLEKLALKFKPEELDTTRSSESKLHHKQLTEELLLSGCNLSGSQQINRTSNFYHTTITTLLREIHTQRSPRV